MMLGSFIALIVVSLLWYKITVVLAVKTETTIGIIAWFLVCEILWIYALVAFLHLIVRKAHT